MKILKFLKINKSDSLKNLFHTKNWTFVSSLSNIFTKQSPFLFSLYLSKNAEQRKITTK